MTWYTAHYGEWTDNDRIHYLKGTFSRKEMLQKAQETANKLNVTVTICSERGMHMQFWKVMPKVKRND